MNRQRLLRLGIVWVVAGLVSEPAGVQPSPDLTVTVQAPSGAVQVAETVEVRIELSQVSNLSTLVFEVTYDGTTLSLEDVRAAGQLAEQGLFAHNPETFPSSTGSLRFGFLHAQGLNADGTLVTLVFRVQPSAVSPTSLVLANPAALDRSAMAQPTVGSGGELRVLLSVLDLPSGLQLFAVPVALPNPDPAAVFAEPAAGIRLAAWDPTGAGTYTIYDGANLIFQPGRGYWTRRTEARQVAIDTGRLADATLPFTLPLKAGWNLLGNPYWGALTWDTGRVRVRDAQGVDLGALQEAAEAGLLEDYVWIWDGQGYRLVFDSSLLPGALGKVAGNQGFWLLSHRADQQLVLMPDQMQATTRQQSPPRRSPPTPDHWELRLVARAGEARDDCSLLGVRPAARLRAGRLLIAHPPAPSQGYVALWFEGKEEQDNRLPLAIDLRSPLQRSTDWDLVAETDQPDTDVVIEWPDLTRLPAGYAPLLTDLQTGARRYLRTTTGYTFRSGPQGTQRRLRLTVDPGGLVPLRIEELRFIPRRGGCGGTVWLRLTLPALVRAQVQSLVGSPVSALAPISAAARQPVTLEWDGRSASGRALPAGHYLLVVTAETDSGQQVRAVRGVTVR